MKKTKLIILLTVCFLAVQFFIKAQPKDSILVHKKNVVYIVPTAVFGDMFWDFNNYWLQFGCLRKVPGKLNTFLDLKLGFIFYSKGLGGSILSDIATKSTSTKGFNLNLEYKIRIENHFYFSTNFFYQFTKTERDGEYARYSLVSDNSYSVNRNVYSVYPKIGFLFINRTTNMYTDIGFGAGIRYVSSHTINKINTDIYSGTETLVNKEFDKGGKFAQKIYVQLCLGYNF